MILSRNITVIRNILHANTSNCVLLRLACYYLQVYTFNVQLTKVCDLRGYKVYLVNTTDSAFINVGANYNAFERMTKQIRRKYERYKR